MKDLADKLDYKRIKYRKGLDYQLSQPIYIRVPITDYVFTTEFFELYEDGLLIIHSGYAWDGISGFLDLKKMMRGGVVHDALYQALRLELLPPGHRDIIDQILVDIWVEDGVWSWVARISKSILADKGSPAAHPDNRKLEYTAP